MPTKSVTKNPNVLVSAKDVKKYRDMQLLAQFGIDPITEEEVQAPCLDHDHNTMRTRGVLSRQINVMLGKIENSYIRYVKWWCKVPLPDLLEGFAEYLRLDSSKHPYHPGFIKKSLTEYSKLSAAQKRFVLNYFVLAQGKNDTERKKILKKFISQGVVSFDEILEAFESAKEVHP